jgi:hypothetical protein
VPTEADKLLVELALKNHLIQQGEADATLAESTATHDAGAVLLAKGLLQQRHLDSLRKKVAKQLEERGRNNQNDATEIQGKTLIEEQGSGSSASDATQITPEPQLASADPAIVGIVLFGQIAVANRLIEPDDLAVALDRQAELAKSGVKRRLGEVLGDKKKLTTEMVQKILAYQEKFIVGCTRCAKRWNLRGSKATRDSLRCPGCQSPLQPMSSLGSVGVQGSLGREETPARDRSSAVTNADPGVPARKPRSDKDPAGLLDLVWHGYKIEKVLGRGGMGAVYLATQLSLGRKVALKVMLRSAAAKSEELKRFVREYKRALAQLSHPNILRAVDAAEDETSELAWFTMELVEGRTFKQALSSGKFPMDKGARTVARVARAMDYAHKKGIVHRDLKPQNIMLDQDDVPKVLDFGLAKTIDHSTMSELTQQGAYLGTPSYMSPEQAGGDPSLIDGRADVYALGAILYEVMTGRPPFRGATPAETIRQVQAMDPVRPTEVFPGTLAVLEPICLKALSKEPGDRQQSALELAEAIEAAVGAEPGSGTHPATGSDPAKPRDGGKDGTSSKGLFGRIFGS